MSSMRPARSQGHDGVGRLHSALSTTAEGLGLEIVGEYRWPRGGAGLYIRDPDGALLELATPGLWW